MSIQIVMMLPSEAASVSLARHALAEALRIAAVAPDCVHEAQVALSEACTNVFHHVTAGQNFEVLINIGDTELTVHIIDTDAGLSSDRLLAKWPDIHVERDHGLALMTAFADHASFESADGSGAVRLKKRLRWSPETAVPSSG